MMPYLKRFECKMELDNSRHYAVDNPLSKLYLTARLELYINEDVRLCVRCRSSFDSWRKFNSVVNEFSKIIDEVNTPFFADFCNSDLQTMMEINGDIPITISKEIQLDVLSESVCIDVKRTANSHRDVIISISWVTTSYISRL